MSPKRKQRKTKKKKDSLHIPGYRYDAEKKKYFRILERHNGIHPLATEEIKKYESSKTASNEENVLTLRSKLLCGLLDARTFSSKMSEMRTRSLRLVCDRVDGNVDENERCLFLMPWDIRSCLLGVCSDERGSCKVVSWELTENQMEDSEECKLKVTPHEDPLWLMNGKINDICLGEMNDTDWCLLISSVEFQRPVTRLSILPLLSEPEEESESPLPSRAEVFEFENNCVWCSCWIPKSDSCAVGMENKILMFEPSGTINHVVPLKSQRVLGINTDDKGNVVYASTSKGFTNGYDTRCRNDLSTKPAFCISVGVPVFQVKSLFNERSLFVSGYKNLLQTIDLRSLAPVVVYSGHRNEYTKIKASVDESENLVSSAGESGWVRFWNLKDGRLIKQIPPPQSHDKNEFVSIWHPSKPRERFNAAQITIAKRKMMIYQSF